MEIFDREDNVLEIVNNGTSVLFRKDNYIINVQFDFYIVVHPINFIDQFPHGADSVVVMRYDPIEKRTLGPVSDPSTIKTVLRRWGQLVSFNA